MAIIGGGTLKSSRFSRAWGVNASEAVGTLVVDSSASGAVSLRVGNAIIFSVGAFASMSGILQEVKESVTSEEGTTYDFTVLDNRLRLGSEWASVIGAWNVEDTRVFRRVDRPLAPNSYSSSSSSVGGDNVDLGSGVGAPDTVDGVSVASPVADNPLRSRRWKHLLPEHARAGLWTYSDQPLSAREILNSAFGGAWAEFSFSRSYHSSMSDVFPQGVDASGGVSLASLISQMLEACGLDLRLDGSRSLVFDRKGSGLAPLPDSYTGPRSIAESISPKPSKVRVLGDPFRVQVHGLSMVPDWKPGWESWIDETAWIRKVATVFNLPGVTTSDCAERAAFAKQVTVAAFVAKVGDASLADYRPAGRSSRMQMPAWNYIQEYLYRSYRLPENFTLGGIPLASLKWSSGLLAGVGISGTGADTLQKIRAEQPEIYPDARAHVMVRGQDLDLIDARSINLFAMRRNSDLRQNWIEKADYDIDCENWSIKFRAGVFLDGLASEGKSVMFQVNKGEGGGVSLAALVAANSDYLNIVVPNENFVIEPAEVKIAICFECGQFQKDFGVGARRTVVRQSGLGMELIDVSNGSAGISGLLGSVSTGLLPFPSAPAATLKELKYADGSQAATNAAKVAAGIIQREVTQLSGGFTRYGITGTTLSPTVDRVSITIDANGGVQEQVEYTKAKPTQAFLAETALMRLQRAGESFPGAEASRNEIRNLRLIAALERDNSSAAGHRTHRVMPDLFSRAVGGEHQSTEPLYDKNSQYPTGRGGAVGWLAGDIVWKDDAGFPSRDGKNFGGIIVSAPKSEGGTPGKDLIVTTRGTVPVRVSGTIEGGKPVFSEPGGHMVSQSGALSIGILAHDAAVPAPTSGQALAMVRLGAGGSGAATKIPPLTLTTSRPAYVPEPSSEVTSGSVRVYVTFGVVNNQLATNALEQIDLPLTHSTTHLIYAKVYLVASSNPLYQADVVEHWEIVHSTVALNGPGWGGSGQRPAHLFFNLGAVIVSAAGVPSVNSSGGGSVQITEHITDLTADGAHHTGVLMGKAFSILRLGY